MLRQGGVCTGRTQPSLVFSDDPDMVHAARRDSTCSFYQPPPPTDIERMRSNMIKEQKVVGLIQEIVGEGPLESFSSRNWADGCFRILMCDICFVLQLTLVLCGCCFWWRTVRGTPMLTSLHNTSARVSPKTFQTVWAFRMCLPGQTQLCWATCLGSTQVSTLCNYTVCGRVQLIYPKMFLYKRKINAVSWFSFLTCWF